MYKGRMQKVEDENEESQGKAESRKTVQHFSLCLLQKKIYILGSFPFQYMV